MYYNNLPLFLVAFALFPQIIFRANTIIKTLFFLIFLVDLNRILNH